jgi:hypothetical protein
MPDNEFPYYKINTMLRRWSQKDGARVVREARLSMDKAPPAVAFLVIAMYFVAFNHTPQGTRCERSVFSEDSYTAELCFIKFESYRSGNMEYVGRLFDSRKGTLLAERVFVTSTPQLSWSPGVKNSLDGGFSYQSDGPSVEFSRGDGAAGNTGIPLPPSMWDRIEAMRPRLYWSERARD